MELIEKMLTSANKCVTDGRYLNPPKGIVLHSVGVPQPSALVFYNNENKSTAQAAVHAFVQPDGKVYQFLPWNKRGWHAGAGTKGTLNNSHIGVEMTEPAGIKYTTGANWVYTNEKAAKEHIAGTYKYAVELFAYLCKMYNFDPLEDGVILSHAEAAKRGMAFSHADVEHIWDKVGYTMNQFRQDVYNTLHPVVKEDDHTNEIKVLYAEFLGRVADDEGLANWNKVWNKDGFQKVYNGISGSAEGKKHYIKGMYRDFLEREASKSEINSWTSKSRIEIYNGIVNSAEYKKKHKTK